MSNRFSNNELNTIYGKSEGINVLMHSSIPLDAPDIAVSGKIIKIAIDSSSNRIKTVFLCCDTKITSCGIYVVPVKYITELT